MAVLKTGGTALALACGVESDWLLCSLKCSIGAYCVSILKRDALFLRTLLLYVQAHTVSTGHALTYIQHSEVAGKAVLEETCYTERPEIHRFQGGASSCESFSVPFYLAVTVFQLVTSFVYSFRSVILGFVSGSEQCVLG